MSKEKLYAVKNDEGEWADPGYIFGPGAWATSNKAEREAGAHAYGGHVVELIEKPNPEVVSKEEAKILDKAKTASYPANYISMNAHPDPGANGTSYEELRLMRALVNSYTVEKEKKYLVELDGLVTTDGAKQYLTKKDGKWFACLRMPGMHQDFTDEELNKAPEWAQQLDREEVTDDAD